MVPLCQSPLHPAKYGAVNNQSELVVIIPITDSLFWRDNPNSASPDSVKSRMIGGIDD